MRSAPRLGWSFPLQRAIYAADSLGKPLVVVKHLFARYSSACGRHSASVLEVMQHQQAGFANQPVLCRPEAGPEIGSGRDLIEPWAERACLVVANLLRAWTSLAGSARWLAPSAGAGLWRSSATQRALPSAHTLRRFLQKELHSHLDDLPKPYPFVDTQPVAPPTLPSAITTRLLVTDLSDPRGLARSFAIGKQIEPVEARGRAEETGKRMVEFLARYT